MNAHLIALISFLFITSGLCKGQYILNGDFENNNAPTGVDQLNLSNEQFNQLVPFCHSFGDTNAAELDLITSMNFQGGAFSGAWYIGVANAVDQFSMELSEPLEQGETYTLSFYDATRQGTCAGRVQVGVSQNRDEFGTVIYTGPESQVGVWTPRIVEFNAPVGVQFFTVRTPDMECWVKVDKFCLDTDTACILVPEVQMPNVFSPNKDGVNDVFKPIVYKGVASAQLLIFNRWGQLIFETSKPNQGWDGTFNNELLPSGCYFYSLEYSFISGENKTLKGTLMLLGN